MENADNKSPHEAEVMEQLITKWLGNRLSRSVLKFCTARDKCGKRIDIALRRYIGEDVKACWKCNIASFIVKKTLDALIKKIGIERSQVIGNLNDFLFRKGLASVLEGIAKYGIQKPFTSYVPFLVVWNISRACNLNCKHCYEEAHTAAPDELTTQEALEAVDKMADAGIAYIAISGGEPLMRPDLWQITKRMGEREVAFSIATNGTMLTKQNVEKLKKYNCRYVQISLDGATAKTHDEFRGMPGMFEKTIQGIKNSVEAGLTVGIATTVTKHNYDEIPDIIKLADKLKVNIWMHYNFIPVGRGKNIIKTDITPEQRDRLLKLLIEKRPVVSPSLLSTAPQYAMTCVENEAAISLTHFDAFSQNPEIGNKINFLAEFVGGCGAARLYCALEPNGDIEPCVFIPIKAGNIKTDDLVDLWHNSELFKKIRDRENFKGNCGTCKYRNICGGCRARAYGYLGDIQESDPGCILNKDLWDKLNSESQKSS